MVSGSKQASPGKDAPEGSDLAPWPIAAIVPNLSNDARWREGPLAFGPDRVCPRKFVGRATTQQETANQSLGWRLGLRLHIETRWRVRRRVSCDNHFAPLVHTHSFMRHE